jgi:hypothetical protein
MIKTTILILGVVFASYYLGIYRASASDEHPTNEEHLVRPPSDVMIVFDFSKETDSRRWEVEDDVVMGGRSKGEFSINDEGNGVFSGVVSLENNGGFSSVQHYFETIDVSPYLTAFIQLKGEKDNTTMSTNSRRLKLGKRWRFPWQRCILFIAGSDWLSPTTRAKPWHKCDSSSLTGNQSRSA